MSTNEPPPYPGDLGPAGNQPPPPPPGYHPPPPPGYHPPPAPGGYGGHGGYDATDAIGYGWRGFRANLGQMLLGALLVLLVGAALYVISERLAPSPDFLDADGDLAFEGGELLRSSVVQILTGGISYFLTAMLIRGALDVTEGRRFSVGAAFSRVPTVTVIVAGIVLGALTYVGLILCVLPGVLFAIFSFFTLYFVVDRGDSTFAALGSSFRLVGANFGQALLTGLLAFLVLMAGVIALVVGLLVALPVVTLAGAYAYRRFQGQQVVEPA